MSMVEINELLGGYGVNLLINKKTRSNGAKVKTKNIRVFSMW